MSSLDDLAVAAGTRPDLSYLGTDAVYSVFDNGATYGPHSEADLYSMMREHRISQRAQVIAQGWDQWYPIDRVVRLPPAPRPRSRGPQYRPGMETNRVLAGVLALLLGGLGIHKFVLGYVGAGILQICLSFLFGVGALIGFIEGIVYLSKSEEQFFYEYR